MWDIAPVNAVTYVPTILPLADPSTIDCCSILEMFIGISCACTPSAAKSFNHHLPNLGAFKSYVSSGLSRLVTQQYNVFSGSGTASTSKDRAAKYRSGQFSTIEGIYQGSSDGHETHGKGIQTVIRTGRHHQVESDGIRLTFEMQSDVSRADSRGK